MTPNPLARSRLKDALEFMAHKFRGATIYDGHPIQTIEAALEHLLDRSMLPTMGANEGKGAGKNRNRNNAD